jgi:hypothetical protein
MITFYPDLQRHHPLRTPGWRWRRACWLLERGRYFSRRRDDAQTGRAIHYLRALTRSRSGRPGARIRKHYSDIHAARQLHESAAPTKLLVQARLLARQSSLEIAVLTGVSFPVLETYEQLLFNIRNHLGARDWICLNAIGPTVRPGTALPDAEAVLKSFAYYGGPLVLEAVLPYLVGGKNLFDPPLDLSTAEGRREQAVRLAVAAQLLPRDASTESKLHKIMLLLQGRERKRPIRRAPAALLAQQTNARVAEAVARATSERAVDVERSVTAAFAAALRESRRPGKRPVACWRPKVDSDGARPSSVACAGRGRWRWRSMAGGVTTTEASAAAEK